MKIYTYCSYKLSPCGFQIAVFDYDSKEENYFLPLKDSDKIEKFAEYIFEDGKTDYVSFGKIPDKDKYIVILKRMKYTDETLSFNDVGYVKNLNMAFEFESDEIELYQKTCNYFGLFSIVKKGSEYTKLQKEKNLNKWAEDFSKMIVPDLDNGDTGLKVKASAVHDMIRKIEDTSIPEGVTSDKFFIIRLNESENSQKSEFMLEKFNEELETKRKSTGLYIVKKKNFQPRILEEAIYPAVLAIITAAILILMAKLNK